VTKKTSELFSDTEINSPYYLLKAIKLFSLIPENNSPNLIRDIKELFTGSTINAETYRNVGEILARDNLRNLAFYVIESGAVSLDILRHKFALR
jgi:hypothetical protein